jgi:hypothetical protein
MAKQFEQKLRQEFPGLVSIDVHPVLLKLKLDLALLDLDGTSIKYSVFLPTLSVGVPTVKTMLIIWSCSQFTVVLSFLLLSI